MDLPVANVDEAEAWNGPEGVGWAQDWEHFDLAVRAYHGPMLEAAGIVDGEQVLDVGCGNGQSSRDAARATPTGAVLGVDLSAPMLERARALAEAEGLTNVDFAQGDAQVHSFGGERFALAMSRFGAMFFNDKVAAFTNIARALRPGGRLLLVVWQDLSKNEQFQTIRGTLAAGRELPLPPPGSPSPFAFADPELGRGWLTAAGFDEVHHQEVRGLFCAGYDADDATAFISRSVMAQNLLADLDDATRARSLDALAAAMQAHETADGVLFDSATWFITARRP